MPCLSRWNGWYRKIKYAPRSQNRLCTSQARLNCLMKQWKTYVVLNGLANQHNVLTSNYNLAICIWSMRLISGEPLRWSCCCNGGMSQKIFYRSGIEKNEPCHSGSKIQFRSGTTAIPWLYLWVMSLSVEESQDASTELWSAQCLVFRLDYPKNEIRSVTQQFGINFFWVAVGDA